MISFPDRAPSTEEILDTESGQHRLAGFIIRQFTDRVGVEEKDGRVTITFRYDH
jgi:xanthine permease XanP